MRIEDLDKKVDKILHYLEDDISSNTRGLVSRVNDLEDRLESHAAFLKNIKWVFGAVGVPLTLFFLRELIRSFMEFNAYYGVW